MAERYTALELISVFDAAFLWYDKDPCEKLYGYGLHGWIVLLTRDSDVRDLAFTLLFEIERGSMEVAHSSWLTDVPDSWKSRLGTIPGGRDPRGTMITVSTLAKFAAKRGHKPKCLAHLIADPQTHTGAAGRPSSMHLVEQEMERRPAEGSLAATISEEARQLSKWAELHHPTLGPRSRRRLQTAFVKNTERYNCRNQARNYKIGAYFGLYFGHRAYAF